MTKKNCKCKISCEYANVYHSNQQFEIENLYSVICTSGNAQLRTCFLLDSLWFFQVKKNGIFLLGA